MSIYDLSPAAQTLLKVIRGEINHALCRGDLSVHEINMILDIIKGDTVGKVKEN